MRATEFISELFQSGKNWKWDFRGSEEALAEFTVGKVNYMFHAYGADGQWEAEFKVRDNKLDRLQKFGLTGTGNSAEVMSTVVDIMREFLKQYQDQIEVLTFSAEEDSRQGLYARMVKRLLPNWTMRQDGKYFTLIAPRQSVAESSQPKSAGCIVVAEDTGRWCLQQRSDQVSDPGVWSTWGGGVEPGETLEQAVLRELAEEGGYHGPLKLEPLSSNGQYATFIGYVPHEFEPRINHESKDWCWVDPDQLPTPLHPGLIEALTVEPVDVEAIHAQALNEHLLSNPGLFENREDFKIVRSFLNLHKTNEPTVGKQYVYSSVQVTPMMNFITVARFDKAQTLVELDNNRAYFVINGTVRPFPESGSLSGDSLSQIYFFESVQQLEKFLVVLNLKFPEYKQSTKILDQSFYENFNDGKKPGRKGLSRRVGIPKKPSLGQLEKIAKSSTGERRRMAQWQLNMRRGKARKNK